jgi:hypothetical protein
VSYNYSDNGLFMFQQPHNNIGMQNMQRFVEGRRLVHTNFTTGDHNEPGNDRYLPASVCRARFNQSACIGCHVNNGRSPAPAGGQPAPGQHVDPRRCGERRRRAGAASAIRHRGADERGRQPARLQNWGNDVRVARLRDAYREAGRRHQRRAAQADPGLRRSDPGIVARCARPSR